MLSTKLPPIYRTKFLFRNTVYERQKGRQSRIHSCKSFLRAKVKWKVKDIIKCGGAINNFLYPPPPVYSPRILWVPRKRHKIITRSRIGQTLRSFILPREPSLVNPWDGICFRELHEMMMNGYNLSYPCTLWLKVITLSIFRTISAIAKYTAT